MVLGRSISLFFVARVAHGFVNPDAGFPDPVDVLYTEEEFTTPPTITVAGSGTTTLTAANVLDLTLDGDATIVPNAIGSLNLRSGNPGTIIDALLIVPTIPTLALSTVKVGPPCHFINRYNKYICSETNDTQSCRMGWERPGNCNDAGYTVCCQLNNDKYYFKAGRKCSDGIVAPGSQPFKPCDTTAGAFPLKMMLAPGAALLFAVATAAGPAPCCKTCTLPLIKYYSVDRAHGFCGDACMDPKKFSIYKKFEANLTLVDAEHPDCSGQYTPDGKFYTDYDSTVTHGDPFGILAVTLDLYAPTGMPDHSCCSTPIVAPVVGPINCNGKPKNMTIRGTGPYCCPASSTEEKPCSKVEALAEPCSAECRGICRRSGGGDACCEFACQCKKGTCPPPSAASLII